MALDLQGLFRLELAVRERAEQSRREAAHFDALPSAEAHQHAGTMRREAEAFDMTADLIVGLQADWERVGPIVRDGYKRLRAEHERIKAAARSNAGSAAA